MIDQACEHYERDGYLSVRDVLTKEEVGELLAAASLPEIQQAQEELGSRERTVHLLELSVRHPIFGALAADLRLIGQLRPLLGEDIQLQHSKLASKPPTPGKGQFRMHQDFAYFPHTNTDLAAVTVYLDDATPDNGCLQVWPGSHRRGLLNHLDDDGHFTGGCVEPLPADEFVDLVQPAGSISIHHCLTMHGSPPNRSGDPRRFIVFEYRADDAYQLADRVFADTGRIVSGRRCGRVRCETGLWTLPRRGLDEEPYGGAWRQIGSAVEL